MSASAVALTVAAIIVAAAIAAGLIGAYRKIANPGEYLVAGRSLGSVLLWLLLAGEIYTAFTFLGMAGWAYGKGAPAYYILCYGPAAYIIGYFTMPLFWNVAKRYGLLTIGDFFAKRYESKALGAFIGLAGFVFLVPYVTLQMTGLQLLISIAGGGDVNVIGAVFLGVSVIAVFVFVTGLRGSAWTSVVKDAVVLAGVVFAGIIMPIQLFGSPAAVIAKVEALKPAWLTLSTAPIGLNTTWFVSTVALNAVAFFLFPQTLMAVYAAKSADALRRNYVFLPLYQVMTVLMLFAGLTALLLIPGLSGPHVDEAFLRVVARREPPWLLGAIVGAGSLAALVPVSVQLLGASGLVAKNVYADVFAPSASDAQRTLIARVLVVVLAALALIVWYKLQTTLVELLLVAYNGMAQFIPGAFSAFWWQRATAWGVAAGIGAGVLLLVLAANATMPWGINIGVIAVVVNWIIFALVSLATKAPSAQSVADFRAAAYSS